MEKKVILTRITIVLMSVIILLGIRLSLYNGVKAAVVNNSESSYTITNSDDEEVLVITMRAGQITIVTKNHAATSNIRWRTKGLTITRDPINSTDSIKGNNGPGPVSDAYGHGKATLWFKDGYKSPDIKIGDIVTTTINFSADQVQKALGEDFEDITKNTKIYLHGIFETYDNDTGNVRKGAGDINGLRDWASIMNAEIWGSNTLKDFKKYYNMPIEFQPALQPNTLIYITKEGKKFDSRELDSVLPNDPVPWNEKTSNQLIGKAKYDLTGYYITKKTDSTQKKLVYHYIGDSDGCKLSDIQKNQVQHCRLGGMNVYLEYTKYDQPTPTLTPTPTPTPTGPITPSPTITPTPSIPEIEIPSYESVSESFPSVLVTGFIQADNRGSERFLAAYAVPTTESLYTQVRGKEYLLSYQFERKVGIYQYKVKVKKNFILKWKSATPDTAGGAKDITQTVPVEYEVTVPRAYGYWVISNLECYKIGSATIYNYSLPGGSVTLYPNPSYYSPPTINYIHSDQLEDHVLKPEEVTNGITLPPETINASGDETAKPELPMSQFISDAKYKALTLTGAAPVKSDYLSFNGTTVISDRIMGSIAPDINPSAIPQCTNYINQNVLYENNMIIEATKNNGVNPSSGSITYQPVVRINSGRTERPTYPVQGINDVVIHTPVVCNPIISADNDKYVQLVKPNNNCVQLVLDPNSELSDFILTISNTGYHSDKAGYFTRDFSKSLRDPEVSYLAAKNGILRNEVQFPFDVFLDTGKDYDPENDEYVKAGTWVVIGRSSLRFYLPTWIQEGIYTAKFRTIAVNAAEKLNSTQEFANSDRHNYVATNTVDFEVSGRIYGLSVYDLSDYPMWEEAFRVPKSMDLKYWEPSKYPDGTYRSNYSKDYSYRYTLGINDQYGNATGRNIKYTFPLVNGSHPFYKNQGILKTGYMLRFSLDTVGSMFSDGSTVVLKPSFYFVDKNGKNRKAVDLYYTEEINGKSRHLVKVGSALDQINIKSYRIGDLNLGIPITELKNTAALRNIRYQDMIWQYEPMFSFEKIWLGSAFRTYVGQDYANSIKRLGSFSKIIEAGIREMDASQSMQRWYGQYYIPNKVQVAPKGYDVMGYADKYGVDSKSPFWLNGGYIIINLNIYTLDERGKQRLSYTNSANYSNNGNCSMWVLEGPAMKKESYKGPVFDLYAGDFFLYYSSRKASDDYSPGAIY